ncbi:hypothetical protein [Kallotenue papyrolyticum]|uniref:hypothetical protein n=1 Tax=Kallotenue papyrolyticum TaxID=1325125 RepID=UPI0004926F59|nr:hypothetical protein [Kallotenue papyrolyticum]
MFPQVRLDEVLTPALLEEHREHIIAFLQQEGITVDPQQPGATLMSERQVKELLQELAEAQR